MNEFVSDEMTARKRQRQKSEKMKGRIKEWDEGNSFGGDVNGRDQQRHPVGRSQPKRKECERHPEVRA